MATINKPILTNVGKNLLNAANSGTDTITYSKVAFSSQDLSNKTDDDIKNMSTNNDLLLQEVTSVPTVQLQANNMINIRAYGSNKYLVKDLTIRTYAILAKNKAGDEILFAVEINSPSSTLIGNADGKTPNGLFYTLKMHVDNTDNFTISADKNIYITQQDLDDNYYKKSKYDTNSWIPLHLTCGYEQNQSVAYRIKNNVLYFKGHFDLNNGDMTAKNILINTDDFVLPNLDSNPQLNFVIQTPGSGTDQRLIFGVWIANHTIFSNMWGGNFDNLNAGVSMDGTSILLD